MSGEDLAPGLTVTEHLNRGADLDVYVVWDEHRACACVAKLVRPELLGDEAAVERLRVEGERLVALAHPHLVRAYDVVVSSTRGPVVVLELLDGETVSHLVERRTRRLPASDIAWLGLHLCSALHYLHREGLLHLDLKPSNVISEWGQAKVIDLSHARPPGEAPAGVGTAQYLAPEQARGGVVGAAADVFGLGGVLFRAATGRRPFSAPSEGAAFEQLVRRADRVGVHRQLPAPMAAAIDACLEPEPGARPSVAEVGAELEAFAA